MIEDPESSLPGRELGRPGTPEGRVRFGFS